MIQFLIVILCAALWRLGGWDKARWSGYRDVLIPVIIGVFYAMTMHWWLFLLVGGATNSIRMGYGAYDPEHDDKPSWLGSVTKDREGTLIRVIYGCVTSFAIGLFPAIVTGNYSFFALYIFLNMMTEYILDKNNANVWITEPVIGAVKASVVWLI